jgi:hypothetical protein
MRILPIIDPLLFNVKGKLMCLILLLFVVARHDRLAAFYLIQALTCLGLSLAVLFVERPVLVCVLHLASAAVYGAIAAAHVGPVAAWTRTGNAMPGTSGGT